MILAVVTVLAIVSVVTLSYRYAIHVPRYWLLVAIMAEAMAILAQINAWSPAPAVEWQAVAYLTAALYLATAMREISLVSDTRLTDLAPGVVAASLVVAAGLAVVVSPAPPGIAWSTDAARVYARIGEEPGDYVVLSVPLGITLDPRGETYGSGTDLQLYAASHRKRSTNGLLAQSDSQGLDAYVRSPLFRLLGGLDDRAAPNAREQLVSTVTDWPVGYVVVHGDRLAEPARAAVLAFLDGQTDVLCRLPGQGPLYVYRARWHPSGCPVR